MAPPRTKYAIPEGWVMQKKVEGDGTEVECFVCIATGQEFCTYNGMMRYVHYAIAREASIYSPDFSPPKKVASSKRGSNAPKKVGSSKRGSNSPKKVASSKQGSNVPKEVGSSKRGRNALKEVGSSKQGSNPSSNLKTNLKIDHKLSLKKKKPVISKPANLFLSPLSSLVYPLTSGDCL
ncbi:uncharacterized protein LOC125472508 [Pyrus x bretschneideri]|uniref:uncharacterized protein LOC125472508 n=1 Tax=Pyrus x bretschneideri TaxID=225117 RepID=UPI00202DE232|nr:uncharacterized protein LOC125472508 [Pyrus x bretschneideri]